MSTAFGQHRAFKQWLLEARTASGNAIPTRLAVVPINNDNLPTTKNMFNSGLDVNADVTIRTINPASTDIEQAFELSTVSIGEDTPNAVSVKLDLTKSTLSPIEIEWDEIPENIDGSRTIKRVNVYIGRPDQGSSDAMTDTNNAGYFFTAAEYPNDGLELPENSTWRLVGITFVFTSEVSNVLDLQ